MPNKVGQENPCSPADMGQGGLCLVKDLWHGRHIKGQWSMVRLLIIVKPCLNHGLLLPKREEVGCFNLTEVSGQFPILEESLVGPDLVFNPVDHQLQSAHSNLSDGLFEIPLGCRDHAVYVVIPMSENSCQVLRSWAL